MSSPGTSPRRGRLLGSAAALAALAAPSSAFAEEKTDLGPNQWLNPETIVLVDILDPAVERIRYSGEVEDPGGGFLDVDTTLFNPIGAQIGTFPSGSTMTPNAGAGVYELTFEALDLDGDGDSDPLQDWEISVVDLSGNVIPGRIWSTRWRINGGGFGSQFAMDGSFFAVVPAGSPTDEAVVELKADGLAGFVYHLIANSNGVRDGNGRSKYPNSAFSSVADHPLYLRPPDPAFTNYVVNTPSLSNASIAPESAMCSEVAPGVPGAEGVVAFDSNVDGVAHLVCDLNEDGVFDLTSDVDYHLLVPADSGANEFVWDGLDNVGNLVPQGTYDCQILLTVGEFHFVANDMETSFPGFRLFQVSTAGVRSGLQMYWNDAEVQFLETPMPNLEVSLETSGAAGVASGAYGDTTEPNDNARSWGHFDDLGTKGNDSLLDTYTWLRDDSAGPFPITIADGTTDTDGEGLVDSQERCVIGTDPTLADTDSDGLDDFEEASVGVSDPLDADSDDDGLADGEETADPFDLDDTDDDGDPDVVDPDDDDDGVPTVDEGSADLDGDTIGNHRDPDDDGDLVPTIDEDVDEDGDATNDDSDSDGTPDFLDDDDDDDTLLDEDPDSDGDPTNDDSDGDGDPNYRDDDDDDDLIPTEVEWDFDGDGLPDDVDGDGTVNHLDPDDDGDGLPSAIEGADDSDGDGLPDFLDPDSDDDDVPDGIDGVGDDDGDLIPNFQDPDDDGDTVATEDEILEDSADDCNSGSPGDLDGDGLPDYRDDDDDGDGIPTIDEIGVGDSDGDGVPNWRDCDDDDDGIPTIEEGDGDTDGDNIPDYLDLDSDNDTIFDGEEAGRDSDDDFLPDFQDSDDDGDGIATLEELQDAAGTPGTLNDFAEVDDAPDTDGDDDPDWLDDDDDDDGIPTETEGGFDDDEDEDGQPNHHDLDSDDDTIDDGTETSADSDGDREPNFLDLDSDGDGVDDEVEGTVDTDGDGTADFRDTDDDGDSVRTDNEVDGDTDSDGLVDRLDVDDDGDGIPTAVEAADGLEFGSDVDDDGLPNWVDLDSDGDELDDAVEGTNDVDQDAVPDYLDPDGARSSYYRGSGLSLVCSTGVSAPSGAGALLLVGVLALRRRRS